jgi:hypothetical protein
VKAWRGLLLSVCLPVALLVLLAGLVGDIVVADSLRYGALGALVIGLFSGALVHLGAGQGVHQALVGLVAGLFVRFFAMLAWCLGAALVPGIDLLVGVLATVSVLVVSLIADAAMLSRSLSGAPAQESAGV